MWSCCCVYLELVYSLNITRTWGARPPHASGLGFNSFSFMNLERHVVRLRILFEKWWQITNKNPVPLYYALIVLRAQCYGTVIICRTQVDDAPIRSSRYFEVPAYFDTFTKSSGVRVSPVLFVKLPSYGTKYRL